MMDVQLPERMKERWDLFHLFKTDQESIQFGMESIHPSAFEDEKIFQRVQDLEFQLMESKENASLFMHSLAEWMLYLKNIYSLGERSEILVQEI